MSQLFEGSAVSGLGVFRVHGAVSQQTVPLILAGNADWVATTGVPGQIADYRYTDLLIPAHLVRVAARSVVASGGGGLHVPTALLVEPRMVELWRDYAWLAAQIGLRREVFTDFADALDWTADQAALWAAQADHRRHAR